MMSHSFPRHFAWSSEGNYLCRLHPATTGAPGSTRPDADGSQPPDGPARQPTSAWPLQVVLRLHQHNPAKNTVITIAEPAETVVAQMLHERRLAPALLAVFQGGRIEQFTQVHRASIRN